MVTHDIERFVGRTSELDTILRLAAEIQRGIAPQKSLINLCGVLGIGKSALLAVLRLHAAKNQHLHTIALELPYLSPTYKTPTLDVKQAILRQLVPEYVTSPPSWSLFDSAAADAALSSVASALSERQTPLVLLIDAQTSTASAVFGWIERGLLLPLVRHDRLIAVIASRAALRWREFDTRRRAETITLDPLGMAESAAQMGVDRDGVAAFYTLTKGLPLANELAREMFAAHAETVDDAPEPQVALSSRIVTAIYERLTPDLTGELRCILEVLAGVREFSLPLLQQLLQHYCDDHNLPRSPASLLITIKQLQDLDVVIWDQYSLSYRVVPVLRQIIAQYVRQADPQRFQAIRQTASDYYRQMLDEVLVSRHTHVIELLWHMLDGQMTTETPEVLIRTLVTQHLMSPDGRQIDGETMSALQRQIAADSELLTVLERQNVDRTALFVLLDHIRDEALQVSEKG